MWRGGLGWLPPRAIAAAAVVLVAATVVGFLLIHRGSGASQLRVGSAHLAAAPSPSPSTSPSQSPSPAAPTPSPTAAPAALATSAPAAAVAAGPAGPSHFATLPPGAALPSSATCAAWVRARPLPENKGVNRSFNQVTGQRLAADFFADPRENAQIGSRVDGAFTGTTQEILRWAACKWGIDEDTVYAQAAKESWWEQPNKGDYGSDANACAPGHGLGVDGQPGQCPQSFGILQNRYPYERSAWPGMATSTAMNADTAYAIWRGCFEGMETWLNTVDRGSQYAAGDAWGCVGRWFAGRWHTGPADSYMSAVQGYMSQRVWEQANFQQP